MSSAALVRRSTQEEAEEVHATISGGGLDLWGPEAGETLSTLGVLVGREREELRDLNLIQIARALAALGVLEAKYNAPHQLALSAAANVPLFTKEDVKYYWRFAFGVYPRLFIFAEFKWNMFSTVGLRILQAANQAEVIQAVVRGRNGAPQPRLEVLHVSDGEPKFALVSDGENIVLSIRGTSSLKEALMDLNCVYVSPEGPEVETWKVHGGMWGFTDTVVEEVQDIIDERLKRTQEKLVITGHSLGAGVAALLAIRWRSRYPTLRCVAFACPCVADRAPGMERVLTVIVGDDAVPSWSIGSTSDLVQSVATLGADSAVRDSIWTLNPGDQQLQVLHNTLQANMQAEKLFPPGQVLWLRDSEDDSNTMTLSSPAPSFFGRLRLRRRMLADHYPTAYEEALAKDWVAA